MCRTIIPTLLTIPSHPSLAMTRKKVKLQFIANDSARKATFKKRKKGLMKKVSEISTLCGIEACAIIFSPYDGEPEVWPSALGVQRVLARFRRMPEMEQSKKMMNQESYIRHRIMKAEDQLRKQQKENRQKEITHVMHRCLAGDAPPNLSMVDLHDLGWLLDQNLKEIQSRIESLKKETTVHAQGTTVMNETRVSTGENGVAEEVTNEMRMSTGENGVAEGRMASDYYTMMNPIQDHQWYMDLLRPNDQSGGDETLLPYTHNNSCLGFNFMSP